MLSDTKHMEVQSIGLAGLEKAQEKLAAVARKLSTGLSEGGGGDGAVGGGDRGDLSAAMVALMEAKLAAGVNLKRVETANEMAAKTVDVLG